MNLQKNHQVKAYQEGKDIKEKETISGEVAALPFKFQLPTNLREMLCRRPNSRFDICHYSDKRTDHLFLRNMTGGEGW